MWKNMGKRSRHEIRADILKVAKTGAIKTRIVYLANLNFEIIKGHVKALTESGRLEKHGNRYYTTEQGLNYIQHVKALM